MTMGPNLLECDSVLVVKDRDGLLLGVYGPYTYEQADDLARRLATKQEESGSTNGDRFNPLRLFRWRISDEDPLAPDPIGPAF